MMRANTTRERTGSSPYWQRRVGVSPGVIDTAAVQRRYSRTAGWAMQRSALGNVLLARYASAVPDGADAPLLLARAPFAAGLEDEAAASADTVSTSPVQPVAGAGGATGADRHTLPLTRLQRRVEVAGVIQPQVGGMLVRRRMGVAPPATLYERLAARSLAAPALPIGLRLDPSASGTGAVKHATANESTVARFLQNEGAPDVAPGAASITTADHTDIAHPNDAGALTLARQPVDTPVPGIDLARIVATREALIPRDAGAGLSPLVVVRISQPAQHENAAAQKAARTPATQSNDVSMHRPPDAFPPETPMVLDRPHARGADSIPADHTDVARPHDAGASTLARRLVNTPRPDIDAARIVATPEVLIPRSPPATHGAGSLAATRPHVAAHGDTSTGSLPLAVARVSQPAQQENATALTLARVSVVTGGADTDPATTPELAGGAPNSTSVLRSVDPGAPLQRKLALDIVTANSQPIERAHSSDPIGALSALIRARRADDGPPGSIRVGADPAPLVLARTSEIATSGASTPALVWRRATNAARPASGIPAETWVSRSVADGAGASSVPVAAPAPDPHAMGVASLRAHARMPELNRLAEQVTRLIARRLDIERERRGGKRWN